jgi:alpha-amylase/alpha-mannosidase (GH57 family)
LLAYIIHAHFYQPPREDPLTGDIPYEQGAYPYPNWNEKIYSDCYKPNAELGNFRNISFNIGPTLFSWLETYHPDVCRKIIEQDQDNVRRYGVGNAIAQAYNHTILPLMSRKDKVTQISWGIADFRHRFGRYPQGMWLPETAVDNETLEIISAAGIKFTILAPWQVDGDDSKPFGPCRVQTAKGQDLVIFFYQQGLSTQISFDPWSTINADKFAEYHLFPSYTSCQNQKDEPQVLLIATDGELYGHHQPLRQYFLERLVDGAATPYQLIPTFPGLWVKNYPVDRLVRIKENTSWSCHHGLGRWLGDCECTPGDRTWKTHLRRAFIQLAGAIDGLYLELLRNIVPDPWLLRDNYIHVILGEMNFEKLLLESCGKSLKKDTIHRIHLILEAQRERQRMFTSCGWFFNDLDRIEPRNNIAYAAQAVVLTKQATGVDLTQEVLEDLNLVYSPVSGIRAADIFIQRLEVALQHTSVIVGFAD